MMASRGTLQTRRRFAAMTQKLFERPVVVSRGTRGGSLTVVSAEQAADFLMADWPGERDERHRDAVDACLKVIEGYRSTEDAETAFRDAAARAGILSSD
jgi:uncharacterized protein DUF982